jgi:phytoene dehydrogenase-like protein
VLRAPPNIMQGFNLGAIGVAFNALGTANILRRLSLEQQRNLLDLFTRSAGEMLDDRFESDLVKALFGFDAIVGHYASPYASGSATPSAAWARSHRQWRARHAAMAPTLIWMPVCAR